METTADAPKESTQARSEHILYVDDEEALVFLATRLLERRGYRVSGFTNAVTALGILGHNWLTHLRQGLAEEFWYFSSPK